jgi:menaquinol-cytochrome c reductase cytochrome b/c subunit
VTSLEERRSLFAKYKQDVKTRGKPFFPYAMFHDTVMSLVVVLVIVALAAIWRYTPDFAACNDHGISDKNCTETGWLGPLYTDKADAGTTTFVPRPDWYFYFLFYLLRIFKWPDSVILGTIGIPTILLLILIAMPFLDRSTERRLLRRPVAILTVIIAAVSMGVLTYKGAAAKESLGVENLALVPGWVKSENLVGNAQKVPGAGPNAGAQAVAGAKIFAQVGCLNCHTYQGAGSSNLGAPDLSAEGAKNKGIKFQVDHLECPSCVNPGSPMPSFKDLGQDNLHRLAVFLESSKGSG